MQWLSKMKKIITVLILMTCSLKVYAEKIDIKFDDRTNSETSVFKKVIYNSVEMGWFYANGNKQKLLNVNHKVNEHKSFKHFVKEIDVNSDSYEHKVFKLPTNILTLANSDYLYKSFLKNTYYPTYFN